MNQFETLSRRLHIIRLVDKPFRYPAKQTIVEKLKAIGLKAVSLRSVERDIQGIRDEYGIHIKPRRRGGGYYLDRPADEDPADFEQMLQLLERREKIRFLSAAVADTPHASRYLQLEQAPPVAGTEHLPTLLEAMRLSVCVQFAYQKFDNSATEQIRLVEPGMLFEYRNRWYLDSYDLTSNGPRTYGLDRITSLQLTRQPILLGNRSRTDRQHVIGVTAPENARPERVLLRFAAGEANYLRTLPLHTSQRIAHETSAYVDFVLHVVINPELIREILAYGNYVEVLEPADLRATIGERVREVADRYAPAKKRL
ncbi:hypothetical protein GCM10023187_45610 [Nibrella viscosa]|uniref:WYL domain-containing protein n=1 Tax=Nibrella viscosa TaxID=1084524 RepID=A0ABP8KSI4_9BACT